ncbi:MAG: hypothetical protein AB1540_11225, partial [Bdellovibrionota bacterium]
KFYDLKKHGVVLGLVGCLWAASPPMAGAQELEQTKTSTAAILSIEYFDSEIGKVCRRLEDEKNERISFELDLILGPRDEFQQKSEILLKPQIAYLEKLKKKYEGADFKKFRDRVLKYSSDFQAKKKLVDAELQWGQIKDYEAESKLDDIDKTALEKLSPSVEKAFGKLIADPPKKSTSGNVLNLYPVKVVNLYALHEVGCDPETEGFGRAGFQSSNCKLDQAPRHIENYASPDHDTVYAESYPEAYKGMLNPSIKLASGKLLFKSAQVVEVRGVRFIVPLSIDLVTGEIYGESKEELRQIRIGGDTEDDQEQRLAREKAKIEEEYPKACAELAARWRAYQHDQSDAADGITTTKTVNTSSVASGAASFAPTQTTTTSSAAVGSSTVSGDVK